MVDVGLYIKNADIQARAGLNADTTAKATAATDIYVLDVEASINSACGYNFSAAGVYAALTSGKKEILKDIGACICACYVIQWNMSGFTSRYEAVMMLNFLWDRAQAGLALLKQTGVTDFIKLT